MRDLFTGANILTVIFGIISFLTSIAAVHYARRTYHLERKSVSKNSDRSVVVFWSREDMIDSLLEQYKRAGDGDDIWAQTVGLQNFPGQVHDRIMTAASRGVTFRYLVTLDHPALPEFLALFKNIASASVAGLRDNRLRLQGLSRREVVIAFPTLTTYTAIKFTDAVFVGLVRDWFDRRWADAATKAPLSMSRSLTQGENIAEP